MRRHQSVLQQNIPYAYQILSLGARKTLRQAHLRENFNDDCWPQYFTIFRNSESWNVSLCTVLGQITNEIGAQFQAIFRDGGNIIRANPISGDNYSVFKANKDSAWDFRRVGSVGTFFSIVLMKKSSKIVLDVFKRQLRFIL